MSRFEKVVLESGSSSNLADVIATNGHFGVVALAPGHVSTDNSTATPLAGGGNFPGAWEDLTNFGVIVVTVNSSHASAADGLMIEFSSDGTNVDSDDSFTIPASTGKTFSFQAATRYFRVSYTNGGTLQTHFRLQTILKPYYVKPSSHRISDQISGQDDAELVKAAITGVDPNGNWQDVITTPDGNLTISDNSSGLAIAKGDVTGTTFIHKFGNAPDFDTGDGEVDVWDGAEDNTTWELMNYVYSTTDDIDSVSSSSAADTQDVVVEGLDANYDFRITDCNAGWTSYCGTWHRSDKSFPCVQRQCNRVCGSRVCLGVWRRQLGWGPEY